jgi:surface antigen
MTGPLYQGMGQEGGSLLPVQYSPVNTPQQAFPSNSGVTRILTGTLPDSQDTTGVRKTVRIKGEMKRAKVTHISHEAHKKRRMLISLIAVVISLLITSGIVMAASPMSHEIGAYFNPSQQSSNLLAGQITNPNLVAQATATAVYHQQTDGYDPYYNGTQVVGNGAGSLSWPLGQCTYWANARYHTLSNYWVSWNGNADAWVAGAKAAGWQVSQTVIHVPSIIVLMPYVQGAGYYGHVAVVESATGNTAHTSNMNWWANGGGWDRVSNVDFTTSSGVYFIWHS